MVTLLGLLGVVAVLLVTAWVATRADPLLVDAPPDRPDLALPDRGMTADDVDGVRFSMAVRGYRMSEVDAVLARLRDELAERDRRLVELAPRSEPRSGSPPRAGGVSMEA